MTLPPGNIPKSDNENHSITPTADNPESVAPLTPASQALMVWLYGMGVPWDPPDLRDRLGAIEDAARQGRETSESARPPLEPSLENQANEFAADANVFAELAWAARTLYRHGITSDERDAELRAYTGAPYKARPADVAPDLSPAAEPSQANESPITDGFDQGHLAGWKAAWRWMAEARPAPGSTGPRTDPKGHTDPGPDGKKHWHCSCHCWCVGAAPGSTGDAPEDSQLEDLLAALAERNVYSRVDLNTHERYLVHVAKHKGAIAKAKAQPGRAGS